MDSDNLVCPVCRGLWSECGIEYSRKCNNKIDYSCKYGCKAKKKPIEKYSYTDINLDSLKELSHSNFAKALSNPISKIKTKTYRKHIILPDKQVTPDSPTEHLSWIGKYISEKRPDVIIDLGDFADMESLSSYDRGKTSFEGRRYVKDIKAAKNGMDILTKPFRDISGYDPEMHLTVGNHEFRIQRVIDDDQRLEGTLSIDNLEYESFGWKVHPFLEIVEVDGVHYSHYFCNQLSGKPIGGESVLLRLKNIGFSFVMGHQQMYLTGVRSLNNGKRIRGIVQGACYLHDEDYRGPQSNNEWRGIFVLHEVCDGDYSLMEISLDYLCRRYEGIPVWEFMKMNYPDIFYSSTWMKHQMKNK